VANPKVPRLYFREDVKHYQSTPDNAWTSYVAVRVRPDSWVEVTYKDGTVVNYPPTAFDMIVGMP